MQQFVDCEVSEGRVSGYVFAEVGPELIFYHYYFYTIRIVMELHCSGQAASFSSSSSFFFLSI
jgi:hypothetical protein